MAVIQSEEIGIAGIKYKRVIKCDSHGTFSTELPDFIAYKLQISAGDQGQDQGAAAWRMEKTGWRVLQLADQHQESDSLLHAIQRLHYGR